MNQYLKDKQYKIPKDIIDAIQKTLISNPNGDGVKRAKYIMKNRVLTYQVLKRLKNFFDHYDSNTQSIEQYNLAGGNLMRTFVEQTLNTDRNAVKVSKKVKQDITNDPNSELKPYQTPRLNENKKKKDDLKKNAVAVIVNNDNKILLLKRSSEPKIWQPSKWALAGGAVEKGETPQQAVEREILEETGLEIKKFVKTFAIQRNPDSIEHVFACRYGDDPTDIKLNDEHTNYGWYSVDEMNYLDIVPNLIEYITLSFKDYD